VILIQADYLPKEDTMDTAQNAESQHDCLPRWYTVQTYAGYERHVHQSLEQQIATFGQPALIDRVTIPIADHEQFPGYVLVHMQLTDATWALVRATAGVTKGCQPQPYHGGAPS
jgi:transcription antitermination factor NusG